jgi:cysteine synthase
MSGAFKFAVYVGDDSSLKDKTALLMTQRMTSRGRCPDGKVLIQADDTSTGYGYGWHEFPTEDWKIQ